MNIVKELKELKERLASPTPEFWIRVRNLAITIGSGAGSVLVAESMMTLDLNETLLSICKYTFTACVAIAGSAVLTKQDSGLLGDKGIVNEDK